MRLAFSTFALLVTLASCVTYRLQPVVPQGTTFGPAPSASLAQVTQEGVTLEVTADWGSEIRFDVVVINRSDRTVVVGDRFRLYSGDNERWSEGTVLTGDSSSARWSRHSMVVVWTRPYPSRTTTIVGSRGSRGSVTIIRTDPFPWVPGLWWWYEDDRWAEPQTPQPSITVAPGASHQGSVRVDSGKGRFYRLVLPIDGKDYEVFFEKVRERNSPFTNL